MTNQCRGVIIPHRDSIWTQNYTLAEITGILYKKSQPEPGIGNGRIYENYKRYEPVSMITKVLQQLWNFEKLLKIMLFVYKKQDSIYRESIRSVSGSKCTLERLFCVTENHSLQERTYIR